MDGASPGTMPLSLGNVWVGETRATTTTILDRAKFGTVCGGGVNVPQNCIVDWPQFDPMQVPTLEPATASPHTHYHFGPKLSDDDVERIAKRVVELMRADTPR